MSERRKKTVQQKEPPVPVVLVGRYFSFLVTSFVEKSYHNNALLSLQSSSTYKILVSFLLMYYFMYLHTFIFTSYILFYDLFLTSVFGWVTVEEKKLSGSMLSAPDIAQTKKKKTFLEIVLWMSWRSWGRSSILGYGKSIQTYIKHTFKA